MSLHCLPTTLFPSTLGPKLASLEEHALVALLPAGPETNLRSLENCIVQNYVRHVTDYVDTILTDLVADEGERIVDTSVIFESLTLVTLSIRRVDSRFPQIPPPPVSSTTFLSLGGVPINRNHPFSDLIPLVVQAWHALIEHEKLPGSVSDTYLSHQTVEQWSAGLKTLTLPTPPGMPKSSAGVSEEPTFSWIIMDGVAEDFMWAFGGWAGYNGEGPPFAGLKDRVRPGMQMFEESPWKGWKQQEPCAFKSSSEDELMGWDDSVDTAEGTPSNLLGVGWGDE